MEITIKKTGSVPVAVITGEIDGKTAQQAQAQLLPAMEESGRLLLNLSGVTYLSSAGLRMLLLLYRQALAHEGKVALVGLSEQIKDTMSVTGFLKFFAVAESEEAALKALE
jgi:anti-sigma B factor antagonist